MPFGVPYQFRFQLHAPVQQSNHGLFDKAEASAKLLWAPHGRKPNALLSHALEDAGLEPAHQPCMQF